MTRQTTQALAPTALDRLKGAVNHAMAAGASACAAWAFAAAAWPAGGLDRAAGLGLAVLLAAFAALNALRLAAVRRGSPRYARVVRPAAATVASALLLWGAAFFF
ncbi:MAG TPA: hypothetical protein VK002_01215 [Rubricoccaceae bacterium]|nr:hypothetical protein [Rubricoccaceae bacterium]